MPSNILQLRGATFAWSMPGGSDHATRLSLDGARLLVQEVIEAELERGQSNCRP